MRVFIVYCYKYFYKIFIKKNSPAGFLSPISCIDRKYLNFIIINKQFSLTARFPSPNSRYIRNILKKYYKNKNWFAGFPISPKS